MIPRTIWHWMLVVAVIGIMLGCVAGVVRLKHRRERFLQLVNRNGKMETIVRDIERSARYALEFFTDHSETMHHSADVQKDKREEYLRSAAEGEADAKEQSALAAKAAARAEYHAAMKRKYEYAAQHPWLSVEPDSPPPDL